MTTPTTASNTLKKSLYDIATDHSHPLRSAVAQICAEADDPASFMQDVLHHGCISGLVTELIYYSDTHQFYDTHYYEIEALRQQCEEDFGQPLAITGDLKNTLAWFAFEATVREITDTLNLDV